MTDAPKRSSQPRISFWSMFATCCQLDLRSNTKWFWNWFQPLLSKLDTLSQPSSYQTYYWWWQNWKSLSTTSSNGMSVLAHLCRWWVPRHSLVWCLWDWWKLIWTPVTTLCSRDHTCSKLCSSIWRGETLYSLCSTLHPRSNNWISVASR